MSFFQRSQFLFRRIGNKFLPSSLKIRYKSTVPNRQDRKPSKYPSFILCTLIFGSALIYTYLKSKNYEVPFLEDDLKFLSFNSKFNLFDISQNRSKFNFIADVVELCAPSVVLVQVKDSIKNIKNPTIFANGSGFIVRHDGLILTNAHVIMIAMKKQNLTITVRLMDGMTYSANVEDVDLESDLATLRINKKNLPVIKLGSSKNLRPGEFVVAIGSPLSLSNSITSGVVSSPNRRSEELGISHNQMSYIQTDAAITFGNSGGPLVNLEGEVIGINAMKVTPGISFAIPVDYAKEFLQKSEAKRKGQVVPVRQFGSDGEIGRRRYLGITMFTLIPEVIFDMQHIIGNGLQLIKNGVLIWGIIEDSPAELGGLKIGDIIVQANGRPVTSAGNIYQALDETGPLILTILRRGQILEFNIEPEKLT
ncbi:serine protease HTRA2, mitochondrial-like [Leptopilina heterotoma]|uniref:serine protease HTRA2, mitochondrial-like n=1 Tax=Leptopilina heterotoma TaxID=63436 RepID=UPI001CA950AA|nr:serine protease HTRA2, mitochondrial-like [Leptopilina heterotoma]